MLVVEEDGEQQHEKEVDIDVNAATMLMLSGMFLLLIYYLYFPPFSFAFFSFLFSLFLEDEIRFPFFCYTKFDFNQNINLFFFSNFFPSFFLSHSLTVFHSKFSALTCRITDQYRSDLLWCTIHLPLIFQRNSIYFSLGRVMILFYSFYFMIHKFSFVIVIFFLSFHCFNFNWKVWAIN